MAMDSRTTVDADTRRTGGKAAKVTLMVDDVPVAQVLQALAEQEKLNLVVSPDVSDTVSLHLTDVPWKQALQTAGEKRRTDNAPGGQHSLSAFHCGRMTISPVRKRSRRGRRQICRWKIAILLCNTPTPELAKAGEKLLSAKGSMTVDKRTNRLLLRDNKTQLALTPNSG